MATEFSTLAEIEQREVQRQMEEQQQQHRQVDEAEAGRQAERSAAALAEWKKGAAVSRENGELREQEHTRVAQCNAFVHEIEELEAAHTQVKGIAASEKVQLERRIVEAETAITTTEDWNEATLTKATELLALERIKQLYPAREKHLAQRAEEFSPKIAAKKAQLKTLSEELAQIQKELRKRMAKVRD